MADNTAQSGADTIATDEVTTLNGGASSGVKVQRVKLGYGDDNTYRDVSDAFALPVTSPRPLGEYMASSYRLAGTAATPINLLTIENTTGSTRRIEVRRIAVDVSISADTAYLLQSYFRLWHRTGVTPTGGTQPTKTLMDSNDSASAANTILRFGASADGTASAITHALPSRSPDREQSHPQNVVIGAKPWLPNDYELHDYAKPPLILRAAETLLVAIAGANSAVNFHYAVKVIWEEF